MKDNTWTIIYIVLGSLVALLVGGVMMMLNSREKMYPTPCEELIQQNNEHNYVPLPKRCEKGDE